MNIPPEDKEMSQLQFEKTQAQIIAKLDEGEKIPEFSEKNARPFEVQ